MHVMLRRTNVLTEETLFERHVELYPYGHIMFRGMQIDYQDEATVVPREQSKALPGLTAETFHSTPIFPNTVLMTRGTVMRIDTNHAAHTGHLARRVSRARAEERQRGGPDGQNSPAQRVLGPMSHNLPEDLFAAEQCAKGYRTGGAAYGIICREENMSAQDDGACAISMRSGANGWTGRQATPGPRPREAGAWPSATRISAIF